MQLHLIMAASVGLIGVACTGAIEGAPPRAAPPGRAAGGERGEMIAPPATTPAAPSGAMAIPAGPAAAPRGTADFSCGGKTTTPPPPGRLWRLTPTQYLNAVGVLFRGRKSAKNTNITPPGGTLSPLEPVDTFYRFKTYSGTHGITDFEVRRSMSLDWNVARQLVDGFSKGTCLGGGQPFETCAASLIKEKGSLLFQRPLTDVELDQYTGAARAAAASLGPQDGLATAFQAMLLAPQFLFRAEVGEPAPGAPSVSQLTAYEVASSIAYTLTNAPPDAELWDAASRNDLGIDQVKAHVGRLMGSPDATARREFVVQHFELERALSVPKAQEGFCEYQRERVLKDARMLIDDVLSTNATKGFLETLLTTSTVYSGCSSSLVYGLKASGKDDTKGTFADRAGLLTQPAFLWGFSGTDENMPVRRGKFVNESLLCRPVPDLPVGTIPQLPPRTKTTSLRERLDIHRADPTCAGCHVLLDPPGLAFETYDHLGRVQTTDGGKPVDARGVLTGADDADGPFNGVADLSRRLSRSHTVERCFIRHGFRFFMGRDEDAYDSCTLDAAEKAYDAGGGDYVALVTALFTSRSFLYRSRSGETP